MIYFVQAPSGPIKIGFTGDWRKRRIALQSGNPERLTTLLVVPGERVDEQALHRAFAAHRVRSEWFAPVDELLAYIESRRGDALAVERPRPQPIESGRPVTFFEWVERDGQAAVATALGDTFHPVRIHRATHAKHAVDEGLIARCEVVLGAEFDRAGTQYQRYQLRQQLAVETALAPVTDQPAAAARA